MNTKRVTGWLAFFGVAAALAWLPEYFSPSDDADANEVAVAAPATTASRGALPASNAKAKDAPIKDLSPAGDLFAAKSWKAAPTLATVTEQAINPAPVVQAPSLPPVPFQFVGRLHDRSDLQVFLQNGEKIYVVRNGDVIDDTWKITGISDLELSLVYLPLHLSQTLSVGSTQ
ncbi:hypothetical protein SAMN04490189_4719 [Pseudomonas koreensis]|uniref:Secretion system X translation initiation factor n=1 Tax=Pseudomonas koreensis TaxID=198620 RepID=A0AAC9FXH1_9PSED|nr:hypothetical protein [Pseudomonas koreensis]ANH98864.1 hypothetical protein A8L59_16050 [Pseudomonas koreensis]KAB0509384.1 hypothetical protein F7R05_27700 [Pseudomonas koreensis]MCM8743925.1 hypothetical protein [Pseudomonas koreensis]NNA64455.1 hypothetical protein [Pseudomonas koreensis]SDE21799.1 hypothetical protein SAMN04490189_4719 [Pseudomonas koreensis]